MSRVMQHLVEVLQARQDAPAIATSHLVEALVPYPTPAFTSITGAGISQDIVEVLFCPSDPDVRITSCLVEVLCSTVETISPSSTPVTTGWVSIG